MARPRLRANERKKKRKIKPDKNNNLPALITSCAVEVVLRIYGINFIGLILSAIN